MQLVQRTLQVFFGLFILLYLTTTSAQVETYEMGVEAYEQNDFPKAEAILTKLAENGHSDAQYSLAVMEIKQQTKQPSSKNAYKWLVKASLSKHPRSLFDLGSMYWIGKTIPQDKTFALDLWQVAADAGNAEAQYNLGLIYYVGKELPQNIALSAKLTKAAVNQGYAPASTLLEQLRTAYPDIISKTANQ